MTLSIQLIPIVEIEVPPGQRTLRDVDDLMRSIQEVGLLQPITVTPKRPRHRLIAGAHRLEAFKRLGRTEIPALVRDLDDVTAELATIDENLMRYALTTLERAELLHRRKQLYELLHPESTATAGPGRGHREKRRKEFAAFTADTAAKTGTSRRTIEQEVQIATQLDEAVKAVIWTLPIADKKVELLQLARLPRERQEAIADQLASGRATSVRLAQRALAMERDPLPDGVVTPRIQVPARAEGTSAGQPAAAASTEPVQAPVERPRPPAAADPGQQVRNRIDRLYQVLQRQHAQGGLRALTDTWSPTHKARYRRRCTALIGALEALRDALSAAELEGEAGDAAQDDFPNLQEVTL